MRKRSLIVLCLILISINAAYGQEISEYTARIDVDGTVLSESVAISIRSNHPTALRKFTYPFSSQVENLKTYDDKGGLESQVELRGGTNYVTTGLREPLGNGENATLLYEFRDTSSISFFNKTYILSTSFPLLANVERFDLALRIPEGTGLKDPNVDVVPAPSEITSDGRAIILKWVEVNPSEFRIFVRFEQFPPPTTTTSSSSTTTTLPPEDSPILNDNVVLGLSILLLIIFAGLMLLKIRSKTRIKEKIDILKEDEQLILKLVAEEDGIGQREIQRRTDFSKTKVSKILAELEKREAIRKESVGKKNKIYLTDKLKE